MAREGYAAVLVSIAFLSGPDSHSIIKNTLGHDGQDVTARLVKKSGLVAGLLVGGGVVLVIASGVLAYPYVHSRLMRPPLATVVATSARSPNAAVSVPSETRATQVLTRVTFQTPESSPTSSPVMVSGLVPTVTPTPNESGPQRSKVARPTRVVIPTLGVDGPVVPVSLDEMEVEGQVQAAWGVPDEYAAGWHETSAALGEPDNMVLNGHNTDNGEIFRDLYTLGPGDEIIVYSERVSRTYAVSQTLILPEAGQALEVRLANARYVLPADDERLTLVTCHPYGSLRNRLIVVARPSQSDAASEPPEDE